MIDFFNANLEKVATAYVGCKLRDDGVEYPESLSPINYLENTNSLLTHLWNCFHNQKELFELSHESNVDLNICQNICKNIFEDPNTFLDNTCDLADLIYDTLTSLKREPRIIVAYFKGIGLEGVTADAVGIYLMKKTEALGYYGHNIISQEGTVVTKAALIFNIKGKINGGFLTACYEEGNTIDWKAEFLNVKLVENEYSLTRYFISLIKRFIEIQMPLFFEMTDHNKAQLLYKTDLYFKQAEDFNIVEFANEVFVQPEVVEEFCQKMKAECNDAYTLEFKIDHQAYKDKKRTLKSKMTLGNVQLIFKGEPALEEKKDDRGNYYVLRERINNL